MRGLFHHARDPAGPQEPVMFPGPYFPNLKSSKNRGYLSFRWLFSGFSLMIL